jgi:hypothetical protein
MPSGRRIPLERPEAVIAAYCRINGIAYGPDMLRWEDSGDLERAKDY